MFYLTTHSTHFSYGYMASDIWLRTILIVRKEARCRHIGYSLRLTARVLLYAPSHIQDNTYHGLCYTNRGAEAGTRNNLMGSPHERSIRRPIAPWANALTTELHLTPVSYSFRPTYKCIKHENSLLKEKIHRISICGRKEGIVLFNNALNNFLFTVIWRQTYGKGPFR